MYSSCRKQSATWCLEEWLALAIVGFTVQHDIPSWALDVVSLKSRHWQPTKANSAELTLWDSSQIVLLASTTPKRLQLVNKGSIVLTAGGRFNVKIHAI